MIKVIFHGSFQLRLTKRVATMTRRNILYLPQLFLALVLVAHVDAARPNIVFILADDLGWRDLSNEGSTFYESPRIDSIANGGMKFTRGYAACQCVQPIAGEHSDGKIPDETWNYNLHR